MMLMLMMIMMMMMMMMMNYFCGMVDRRKVFGLISCRDHYQRSPHHPHHPIMHRKSPTLREQGLNLRRTWVPSLVEWSCAIVITTTNQIFVVPKRYSLVRYYLSSFHLWQTSFALVNAQSQQWKYQNIKWKNLFKVNNIKYIRPMLMTLLWCLYC